MCLAWLGYLDQILHADVWGMHWILQEGAYAQGCLILRADNVKVMSWEIGRMWVM